VLTYFLIAQVLTGTSTGERVVITPTTCTTGQFINALSISAVGTCATPVGGGAVWGSITGTLATQTDLQTALDGKEPSGVFSGVGACGANTWASTLNDTGAPTCTQPGFGSISGTVTDGQLASSYSGVGACSANNWASTLSDNAAPTCTQPGFSSLSGTATDAQIPGTITLDNLTQVTTRAISDTTGTLTVARGGTGAAPGADDQLLVSDSTSAATWKALNDCTGAGKALTYVASTNSFGCNTISGSGPTYVLLTANRTNATTSYADITDLIIPVSANTRYDIECKLIYSANATTTGIGIGWTGPASPTQTGGSMRSGLTSATVGGTTSVGNDTGGVTTASVATTGNFAVFEGFWRNGANAGNVQMRFKSEVAVANGIVIQAGSWCKFNSY